MEAAANAETKEEALQYAKKALKYDKNHLDAEVFIAELTEPDDEALHKKYDKLMKKAEAHLIEEGCFDEDSIGHFWSMIETRPYMRLRFFYIQLLIPMGKFRLAITHCEDMHRLCENDNLMQTGMCRYASIDELVMRLMDHTYLYQHAKVLDWAESNLPK